MEFISIVIGQYRGTVLMSERDWQLFQMAATSVISSYIYDDRWLEYYHGKTYWAERMEPCLTLVGMGVPVESVPAIKAALTKLATEFGQDSISLRYGSADLVTPS